MNTFKLMFSSIADLKNYGKIVRIKTSTAFAALFFIAVIFGSIRYAGLVVTFSDFAERNERLFVSEVPSFTVTAEKGLDTGSETPVVFQMGSFLFVMDDSDISDTEFQRKYGEKSEDVSKMLEVSRHSAILKIRPLRTVKVDLADLDFIAPFTKEDLLAKMHYWRYVACGLFPLYIIHYFLLLLLFAFILSFLSLWINRILKWGFSYSQLFAASVFSLMIPFIISTVTWFVSEPSRGILLFNFLIAFIFLCAGLKKAREVNSQ